MAVSFHAQQPAAATTGTLQGTVTDSSGAAIAHAAVHISGRGLHRDLETGDVGRFSVALPPGVYTVEIASEGFDAVRRQHIVLRAADRVILPVRLHVEHVETSLEVDDDTAQDAATALASAGAMVLSGKGLAGLSDDDATFQQQLKLMAGALGDRPSILVNGFSTTTIPPKQQIQSVRINANPYSAMYDSPGLGRLEITTRVGQQAWHGQAYMQGTTAGLNAPNPFTRAAQPDYNEIWGNGSVGGSIGRKTSVLLAAETNSLHNNVVVNAVSLDAATAGTPLSFASAAPQFNQSYTLTVGRQWTRDNQTTLRFGWVGQTQINAGTGSQTLPTAGYNALTGAWTLQLRDVQTRGGRWVVDEGVQYVRTRLRQDPNSALPTLLIQGVALGGGSPLGALRDDADTWELQQTTTYVRGHQLLRFGGRLRFYRDSNSSTANYMGEYIFPTLAAYQAALATGTGATQGTVTSGMAAAIVSEQDAAVFAEDEWSPRNNLTLTAGFRLESQTAIADHVDPAPRLGVSYSIMHGKSKTPLVTLRGGLGYFYDRFPVTSLLTAVREDGIRQMNTVVVNPRFNPMAAPQGSGTAQPTRYQISPTLHTPTDLGATLTADHRFAHARLAASLLYLQSTHQFLSRNINAPLPGTYDPANPTSGTRPFGGNSNIYQFSSDGTGSNVVAKANFSWNPNKVLTLNYFMAASRPRNDAGGLNSFPSNQYNLKQDYGVVARNNFQATLYTNFDLPHDFYIEPYITYRTGVPFNITTGTDLNGDQQYTDRPAFAGSSTAASVVQTRFGALDAVPNASEALVPINAGSSPAFAELTVTAGKSFKVGPRPAAQGGKPQDRPWTWSLSGAAENLTNHTNAAPPIGVLLSPSFGKSINLVPNFINLTAANRVIYFGSTLRF